MMLVKHSKALLVKALSLLYLIILINKKRLSERKHRKGLNENQAFSGQEDFIVQNAKFCSSLKASLKPHLLQGPH